MFEALPEEVLERLCRGLSDQVLSRMKQIGMRFYVFIQEFAVTLRRSQLYGSFAQVEHRHSRTNDSVEGSRGCWLGSILGERFLPFYRRTDGTDTLMGVRYRYRYC